jgi:hypothetical protein
MGGANLAWIGYNDDDVKEEVTVSPMVGGSAGLEGAAGSFRIGLTYIQRGSRYSDLPELDTNKEAHDLYNYLSLYVIRQFQAQDWPVILFGLQLGLCLGGESGWRDHLHRLEGHDFEFDYGLLVGLEHALSKRAGWRVSYYHGLGDVAKDIPAMSNWKNRGMSATLIYTLPEPKRLPSP